MSLRSFVFKNFLFDNFIKKVYRAYLTCDTKQEELIIKSDEKVLLLAPHQDDETIGAGGTIAKFNKNFTVVCLTKGIHGIKNLSDEECSKIRQAEFNEAMGIAGVDNFKNLNITDREIFNSYDEFEKLNLENYDYIFIPNILDTSLDHKSVGINVAKFFNKNKQNKDIKIVLYEVWTTLPMPNYYSNITDFMETKTKMLQAHNSQMNSRGYLEASKGLSTYRGLIPNVQNAEAFLVLSVKEFLDMAKIIFPNDLI